MRPFTSGLSVGSFSEVTSLAFSSSSCLTNSCIRTEPRLPSTVKSPVSIDSYGESGFAVGQFVLARAMRAGEQLLVRRLLGLFDVPQQLDRFGRAFAVELRPFVDPGDDRLHLFVVERVATGGHAAERRLAVGAEQPCRAASAR